MRRKIADTFIFTPEIGRRLRELRLRAGLTQAELAYLMGRVGQGGANMISRLEAGKVKEPSLRLILDYLRACRAKVEDLAEILNRYTSQESVVELKGREEVVRLLQKLPEDVSDELFAYDLKSEIARRRDRLKPVDPETRVLRARRFAASVLEMKRLNQRVSQVIEEEGWDLPLLPLIHLRVFSREVWGVLKRTRSNPERRERLLNELRNWFKKEKLAAPECADRVYEVTCGLFKEMEEAGELDQLPGAK